MLKKIKKITAAFLAFCLLVCLIKPIQADAAVKLNYKKKVMHVGEKLTMKVKATRKKVKWSSSNKKIAAVSKKGKVTAKRVGVVRITAKVGKKTYSSKLAVVESESKQYKAGVYKVGKTIPEGEYVLFCKSKLGASFQISENGSQTPDSIISSGNFTHNYIISVHDGEYLTLNRCVAYPEEETSKIEQEVGMFRIGIDVPEGDCQLIQISSPFAYYEILSDLRNVKESIVEGGEFTGNKYITVKEGQYLKLERCKIIE